MKAKVLIIPLLIVISVAVFIGLVYPQYSNGSNGLKENYAKLKDEKIKLVDLQEKNKNVGSLFSQISSFGDNNILYSFVPEKIKEEEIINNLNSIASSAGLLLFEAAISQPKQEIIVEENFPEVYNGGQNELEETTKKIEPKNIKTDIKLLGSYDKIKTFLANLEKLNHNNNFEQLKINRNKNEGGAIADSLAVDASIEFNFFNKIAMSSANAGNDVFSSNKLETKVVNDIKNQKNINNLQIIVEQKGKTNIFLP